MDNKVKLDVLGFSFNQKQSGTYGLVLSEEDGVRRLMVVVGAPEAQSIAFVLQNTIPPRPLAHDLIKDLLETFGILLEEVIIDKYEDGVFFSKLILMQYGRLFEIDSRTSDAIAIALRMGAPIYTYSSIMKSVGIVIDEKLSKSNKEEIDENALEEDKLSMLKVEELEDLLNTAIEKEDYEFASVLRDELSKKRFNQ